MNSLLLVKKIELVGEKISNSEAISMAGSTCYEGRNVNEFNCCRFVATLLCRTVKYTWRACGHYCPNETVFRLGCVAIILDVLLIVAPKPSEAPPPPKKRQKTKDVWAFGLGCPIHNLGSWFLAGWLGLATPHWGLAVLG